MFRVTCVHYDGVLHCKHVHTHSHMYTHTHTQRLKDEHIDSYIVIQSCIHICQDSVHTFYTIEDLIKESNKKLRVDMIRTYKIFHSIVDVLREEF